MYRYRNIEYFIDVQASLIGAFNAASEWRNAWCKSQWNSLNNVFFVTKGGLLLCGFASRQC